MAHAWRACGVGSAGVPGMIHACRPSPNRTLGGAPVTESLRGYPIIDVSSWQVEQVESAGRGTNTWLMGPNGGRWLHKLTRVRPDRREGQEWAEKISAELGQLIGIPTARIELARRDGAPGCISADLKPGPAWEFQAGSVLISEFAPDFIPKTRSRQGHTLANVRRVLQDVRPPVGAGLPAHFGAFDVFCGYLLFDAWIANQDRHVENWSVLRGPSGLLGLAPTYDHGSTLGFNLTDKRRLDLLADPDAFGAWLSRGRADKFQDGRGIPLVTFARRALAMTSASTWDYWRARFGSITPEAWARIVRAVPEMSDPARTFVNGLLNSNLRRLLDAGD